jgi:hypothetical protein
MKNLIAIVFSISLSFLFGQESLSAVDTTFDYQERFYENNKLIVTNTILYIDSINTYTLEQIQSNSKIDTNHLERVKNGLWIEYFDKKWNECDSSKYYYYRLGEYDFGYTTGKIYYFNKDREIVKTALRYPKMKDTIFEGVRKTTYDNGTITWIEYQRFTEDSLKGLYVNLCNYYPNGKIKTYALSDDFNNNHHSLKYNKQGLCTYELRLNRNESFRVKKEEKRQKRNNRTQGKWNIRQNN